MKCEEAYELALHFAALLRSDVTRETVTPELSVRENFTAWWALYGRREYPAWRDMPEALRAILFEPPSMESAERIPVLLHYLRHQRTDVRGQFDFSTPGGRSQGVAWLFVDGLKEYDALDLPDETTLRWLNSPLPASVDAATQPSRLMRWLFDRRPDVQAKIPNEPLAVILWCLSDGLGEHGLGPLLDEKWRSWALESLRLGTSHTFVPRIAALSWQLKPDVRMAFDVEVSVGRQGLVEWAEHALGNYGYLHWLQPKGKSDRVFIKTTRNTAPFGVNLVGFPFGELGVGEDVRMAAAACDAVNIPYAVVPIDLDHDVRQSDEMLADRAIGDPTSPPYAINIFCLTGFDTAHVYLKKGRALFTGQYNIGWWPWELPVWPGAWRCAFDLVDEVWAATEFTRAMYAVATEKPTVRMPLPVSVQRIRRSSREDFGLDNRKFLFLYVFDSNSYLSRKNPEAVVAAFQQAFDRWDNSVGLVIKTMNPARRNNRWLQVKRICATDPRIVMIEDVLDRPDVLGLMRLCDAYISLHRSEGFGRTLAEAMLMGKPVVATNFSGNTDFLNDRTGFPVAWRKIPVSADDYPFISAHDSPWWADPDISHAAIQMKAARHVAVDREFSRQLQSFSIAQFSPAIIGPMIHQRLAMCRATPEFASRIL